ncbi:U3 snoRNP protein [Sorochytrium milnesiophthora]
MLSASAGADGGNRFKYRNFSDRLKSIRIDVNHRIGEVHVAPESGHDSFIAESLEQWKELNCTADFTRFVREVQPLVRSLPLVLYNKDKLVDIFVRHLGVVNSGAYEPILSMLPMLAKDLRGEFYPYLETILTAVLPLTRSQDPETLEWSFNAIAYLFKYLNRRIQDDITPVFRCLAPILGENQQQKAHIRLFAAESFAYLIRKMPVERLGAAVDLIVTSLEDSYSTQYSEGLAMLFFEAMRHVSQTLHSKTTAILHELLRVTASRSQNDATAVVFELINKALILVCQHADQASMTSVWGVLVDGALDALSSSSSSNAAISMPLLSLLATCVTVGREERLHDVPRLYEVASKALPLLPQVQPAPQHVLKFVAALLYVTPFESQIVHSKTLLDALFQLPDRALDVARYGFIKSLLDLNYRHWQAILLPQAVKFCCERAVDAAADVHTRSRALLCLADTLSHPVVQNSVAQASRKSTSDDALSSSGSALMSQDGQLRLSSVAGGVKLLRVLSDSITLCSASSYDWHGQVQQLTDSFIVDGSDCNDDKDAAASLTLSCVLTILRRCVFKSDAVLPLLKTLLGRLLLAIKEQPAEDATQSQLLQSLAAQTLSTISELSKASPSLDNALYTCAMALLPLHNDSALLLEAIAQYMANLRQRTDTAALFALSKFTEILPLILQLVASHNHAIRLAVLRLASCFEQPVMAATKDHPAVEPCPLIHLALQAEAAPCTVAALREKQMHFRNMALLFASKRVPLELKPLLPRLVVANLTVRLAPIWKELRGVLSTASATEPRLVFDTVYDELTLYRYRDYPPGRADYPDTWKVSNAERLAASAASASAPEGQGKRSNVAVSFTSSVYSRMQSAFEFNGAYYVDLRTAQANQFLQASHVDAEPTDQWSFVRQLLQVLIDIHAVAERYSQRLVLMFLQLVAADDDTPVKADATATAEHPGRIPLVGRQQKQLFLELFSKCKRPEQLHRSDVLKSVYERLLTSGDSKTQSLALDCLLTFKNAAVTPYAEQLHALADESTFRGTLHKLSLSEHEGTFEMQHRPEAIPVLFRLLFGKMFVRSGKSARVGLAARRVAVLAFVAGAMSHEIGIFVDLLLEPFAAVLALPDDAAVAFQFMPCDLAYFGRRRLTGFLTTLEDLFKQVGHFLGDEVAKVLKVLLYVTHVANKQASTHADAAAKTLASAVDNVEQDAQDEEGAGDDEEQEQDEEDERRTMSSQQWRVLRNLGIRRLVQVLNLRLPFDYVRYMPAVFASFVSPRIPQLSQESAQVLSPILQLALAFSRHGVYQPFLVDYDDRLLTHVFATLSMPKVNGVVAAAILEIAENLLFPSKLPQPDQQGDAQAMDVDATLSSTTHIIQPYVTVLLDNVERALSVRFAADGRAGIRSNIAMRQIHILAAIAPLVQESQQAVKLVELLMPSLKKPPQTVSEDIKVDILTIIARFARHLPDLQQPSLVHTTSFYAFVSQLFSVLSTRPARTQLLSVFAQIAQVETDLTRVSELIADLNSVSATRLDEPDFDRRLAAFARLNEELFASLAAYEWLPVLHNLVFLVVESDELSLRNSASFGITKFITRAAEVNDEPFMAVVTHVLFPWIKRCVKNRKVNVRSECISVLDCCVKTLPTYPAFQDLVPLLADGVEEANFFNNIYHLQVHRRARALKRLADVCTQGALRPSTLVNILLPLASHVVYDVEQGVDHNLLSDAIEAIGAICGQLPWSPYYSTLRGFLSLAKIKPALEKAVTRTLIAITDAFHFDVSDEAMTETDAVNEDAGAEEAESDEDADADDQAGETAAAQSGVTTRLDEQRRIQRTVTAKILPELNKFATVQKDSNVKTRVPMMIAIAKLLRRMPESLLNQQLPLVLTKLCYILRSHLEDARDTARDTMLKIARMLEPQHLHFIVQQMQEVLTSGYQLHVLGYSVHALLVGLRPQLKPGYLDHCVSDLVRIAVADIFGDVGAEKDAEDYVKKMKELRATKSYDTLDIVARYAGMQGGALSTLLVPLKQVMSETTSPKKLRDVDEALRRVSMGLSENGSFSWQPFLVFVHGLVTENLTLSATSQQEAPRKMAKDPRKPARLAAKAASTPASNTVEERTFATNAHKFVEFGLNLLYNALKHKKFKGAKEQQVSMLDPFVGIVANALETRYTLLLQLAMKTLNSLVLQSLPSVDRSLLVITRKLYKILDQTPDAKSETATNAFKLLTTLLRTHEAVRLTDQQYRGLIKLMLPNLEEPAIQSTLFALIKVIISRKVMLEEVYEMVDAIAKIMVTNPSISAQQLCRQVYLQFLLDYPQGPKRFENQITFLVKNLTYKHESGRTSVMELLHTVLNKIPSTTMSRFYEMMFVSLVLVLVNDESAHCREMASGLLKRLLTVCGKTNVDRIVALLDRWLAGDQASLKRAGCQVYGLLVETQADFVRDRLPALLQQLDACLTAAAATVEQVEPAQDDDADDDMLSGNDMATDDSHDAVAGWEVAYYALTTFSKTVPQWPATIHSSAATSTLAACSTLLLHRHTWIRLASAKALGAYFALIDSDTGRPMVKSAKTTYLNLEVANAMAERFSLQLRSEHLSEELGSQIVRNVFFLAKFIRAVSPVFAADAIADQNEDGDSGSEVGSDAKTPPSPSHALYGLLRQLSYFARVEYGRNAKLLAVTCVVQIFAAVANALPNPELLATFHPILAALHRIDNEESIKQKEADDLRTLSREVIDMIRKKIGTTVFYERYQRVQAEVTKTRQGRRQRRAFEAVAQPELAAQRKLKKNEHKKEIRKRKAQTVAATRVQYSVKKSKTQHT